MSTKPPDRFPKADEKNTAPQHPGSESGAGFSAPSRPRQFLQGLTVLLLLVILAIAAYSSRLERETLRTVRFISPGEKDQVISVPYGETVSLPEGSSRAHYRFLFWADEDGRAEERPEVPVYQDRTFTAQYALTFPLDQHIPYLQPSGDGILNIGATVTVRDFVMILHTLLDTDEAGSGRFTDVAEDDPCFDAAALLKDLGVFSGTRLHPDEPLTRYEMLRTLLTLAPPEPATDMTKAENEPAVRRRREARHSITFSDLAVDDARYPVFAQAAAAGWISCGSKIASNADKSLCFGDLALVINHALHRDCPRLALPKRIGTILDVPDTSVYYDAAVEAAIPHEYRIIKNHEVWLSSEPLPLRKPGFFFSGVRLHYIDRDGNPAADSDLGGLHFNRNGEITTGVPELDEQLWDILAELIDPAKMTREEMLRVVYEYVVKSFDYRTWTVYERGAEGWAEKEALRMLREKRGNCYCFAALFYELARFVGFDAQIYSGIVYGDQRVYRTEEGTAVYSPQAYTPHGWVEIAFDGEDYIFDTEYDYRNLQEGGTIQMFMAGEGPRGQYGYRKGPAPEK